MSKVTVSIELNINGKVVHGRQAKEALENYGRTIYQKAYRKMERLSSRAIQWAEEFDRQHPNLEPVVCDGTIICNNAEGCGKRNCPARSLAPSTWSRKWKTL